MNPAARIVTWLMSTLTVLVLLFGYKTSTAGPGTSATASVAAVSGSLTAGPPSATATPDPTGTRTVTGSVAQTEWGPVQVELTLDGSTITDVAVVQYPSGNGRDVEINSYALPVLIQETLDAQSARIDMVSGATITSRGYLASLQAALDSASA